MIFRPAGFLLALSLIFLSCKKSDEQSGKAAAGEETCIQARAAQNGDIIEGKYIVTLTTGTVSGKTLEASATAGKRLLSRVKINEGSMEAFFGGDHPGFVAKLTQEEATALADDAQVNTIEHDRIIALSTCFTVVEPRLLTWNITRVGYGDGTGKKAWVIDTGIDFDHPDLLVDVAKSKSFISGSTSADDENGHGTHVAGVIAAKNNTFGVLGVASGATVISLRVLDKEGKGTLSAIIQALAYVNSNASAGDVVNMSVGEDEGISETLDRQVQAVAARGIFFAIAAGNDSQPANKFSPGRANGANIYTVTAIDSLDNFATFCNYGNDVSDYAVPGVRILSTYMGGKYAYMSGTSMAAPHMAGILLLKGNKFTTSGTAKNDPDGQPDLIAHF